MAATGGFGHAPSAGEAAAPGLLEREDELAAVGRFVDEATHGRATLLVEGEPGIGKTELWNAAVGEARGRDMRVLASRPAGAETQLSFAVLRDLLGGSFAEAVEPLPEPQRRALEVALLFEEAGEAGPDAHTIAAATLGALRALADADPLVVAIDDAQWIDEASAAALAFAVRRLGDAPVSFLVGRRSGERRPETEPFDDAIAGRDPVALRVGPLRPSSIRHLIRDRLGVAFTQGILERLHTSSGGNPFYALELARALGRRSGALDPYGALPVPDTLQGLVRERLDAQPAEVQEVLAVVAALSDPTLPAVEATAPPGAVDDAVHAGLIVADGDRLRFAQPLLASAAYTSLGPRARRDLHRRLAELATGEERARHLSLAADGPSAHVAGALHTAARAAAARGAIGAAAELADHAVRLTPPGEPDLLAQRQRDAASYQVRHGDATRARVHLEALVAREPGDPLRASALLRLARLREEHPSESLAICEQVVAEAADDLASAEAHQLAAEMSMLSGNVSGALEHAQAAVELAGCAGDDAILVECLGTLCHYETYVGRITPGLLERAVELEQRVVRPSNNYSPREILGLRLMYADRLDEGRALLEESLAAVIELGDELDRMSLLVHLTQLECRAGNLARAREHAREARLVEEQLGGWALTAGGFVVALAAAHVGRVDEARAASERGVSVAAETDMALFRVMNHWARGFLELSLGDAAEAARLLRDLPEQLEAMGYVNPGVRPVYADAIEARIAAGELDVEPLIVRLASRGAQLDYPWAQAAAARCRGVLLAAQGDLDGALDVLATALGHHDGSPQPLERGRTLLALGTVQRRAKRRGDARETLGQALELFDALGAGLWAEKTAAELARIPGRGRGSGELSETERRVAELVSEGLSNREIAAAMFVSVRTVEANLSRVYAKLGLRSRTELARRFGEAADA